ncbi:MAG: GTPase Era [Deltaproteobacteria bacterium]|nr:GTPase Era [Deltaproteobacteria bacterium]
MSATAQKSGFVAIVGLPNTGKSTLFNAVMGQKLAIVSPKPQTTRYRLTGVLTTDEGQMALVDLPGLFKPKSHFQEKMIGRSLEALEGADVVWYVRDLDDEPLSDVEFSFGRRSEVLRDLQREKKLIIVINKVDTLAREKLLPYIDALQQSLLPHEEAPIPPIVPLSARRPSDKGTLRLLQETWALLPDGPLVYPKETRTDRNTEFFASEFVREQVFRLIRKEIPYGIGVTIDHVEAAKKRKREKQRFWATICVSKETHKGILIGDGGKMLKQIGTKARQNLMGLLRTRCELFLHVAVKPEWHRHDELATPGERRG